MTDIKDIIKTANVAVITGGASGIGLAAARRFAEAGMCIAIADRNADQLGAARVELEAIAGEANVMAVETDIAHRHELEALERAVLQRFGRVHVLMNNAGIQPDTSIFSANRHDAAASPASSANSRLAPSSGSSPNGAPPSGISQE